MRKHKYILNKKIVNCKPHMLLYSTSTLTHQSTYIYYMFVFIWFEHKSHPASINIYRSISHLPPWKFMYYSGHWSKLNSAYRTFRTQFYTCRYLVRPSVSLVSFCLLNDCCRSCCKIKINKYGRYNAKNKTPGEKKR